MSLTALPFAQWRQGAIIQTDVVGTGSSLAQHQLCDTCEDLLYSSVLFSTRLEIAAADVPRPVSGFSGVDGLLRRQVLLVADHCNDCR